MSFVNKRLIFYGFIVVMALLINIKMLANEKQAHVLDQDLIYKVDDLDHANQLAKTYYLNLNQLSPSGLATYQVSDKSPIDDLLAMGFSYNQTSFVLDNHSVDQYNDPYIDNQYALDMMDTYQGWSISEGSNQVTVAVIDTGIDINHIEFQGLISPKSYNAFTLQTGIENVIDTHGHGTMVAGIIAAKKNNQEGIAGIASNINLMVIKANDENQGAFEDKAIIEGIYYATDNGADVINLSLGNSTKNIQMEIAVNYAYNNGVVVVAAAGNDGVSDPLYPAAFARSISVSSVDSRQTFTDYSNYGQTVDISAPGSDITTTVINQGYGTVSGTSFATPQVTGVIALMLSYFDHSSVEEITQRLLKSAKDQGDPGKDIYYGHGLVNTYNALAYDFVSVNFQTNGGSEIKPIFLIRDEYLTLTNQPSLEDYIFQGWYLDPQFTQAFNQESTMITDHTTLYAKYTSEYHTITFITQADDVETITVYHGDTFNLPESYLDYHEFYGWTLDPNNNHPYAEFPVYNDITLYADFKPIAYNQVDLYLDGDLYDSAQLKVGSYYQPSILNETGYVFDGWYFDSSFTKPFHSNTYVNQDLELYGRLIPIKYPITLIANRSIYDIVLHPYNQTITLPELEKDDNMFLGWYYDADYTRPYQGQVIDQALTLYARFAESAHLVTYIIDNQAHNEWYVPDEIFEPKEPFKKGFSFMGFYYDQALTIPYQGKILNTDITLYADFKINRYQIRFFDYDQETILFETALTAGSTVIPPKPSDKPSSLSFTYKFIGWSQPITNIYHNTDIYPIYQRTFIPGSIQLSPGIDTISVGDQWIDGGVSELDNYLYVEINHSVDTDKPGRYTVFYDIYDQNQYLLTIERIVKVIDIEASIFIELNPGITTIIVGQPYIEAGITHNQGQLEIISDVNTKTPGVYKVIYRVTFEDIIYEKTRYVHVIDTSTDNFLEIYIQKKEDDLYVA